MKTSVRYLYTHYQDFTETSLTLFGWVRNNRAQKAFGFINLNDGTFFETIQVVYDEALENFKEIQKLRVGSSIKVKGELVLTPKRPQPFEIKAKEVELIGDASEDYPIQPKRHSREFLRKHAHLRPRTNLYTAVFKIRSLLTEAIHEFFQSRDFIYLTSPIITASDAEGAGDMFQVTTLDLEKLKKEKKPIDYTNDFFGKKTHLTVSGQLQAEVFAQAFRDVYTFGPTFRAEQSHTMIHVSEPWMVEPEMAFADLSDNMDVAEAMVKYIIKHILKKAPQEMKFLNKFVDKNLKQRLEKVLEKPFERITHQKAIDILKAANTTFDNKPEYGNDLFTEHEKYLVKYFDKPVFVTDWPKDIKAFYMRLNDDQKTVAAVDLLVPGAGELIGGSQREERLDVLKTRMKEMNIEAEELWWYLDLRQYGSTPHSGYGLGLDRMVMYLTSVENIRDVVPFPRTPKNCEF